MTDTTEISQKLFNKYDYDVTVEDDTIRNYISMKPKVIPHTHGRIGHRKHGIKKNVVELLVNKLMRGGTGEKIGGKLIRTAGSLQGKKTRVMRIVEEAFDIVAKQTKDNPIRVLTKAIENSAPREDTTRVEYGGVRYQVSVDLAPKRRVDMALRNITVAAILGSFDKKATLAQTLANEIILAGNGDVNSYAMKRRDEVERIARSAR